MIWYFVMTFAQLHRFLYTYTIQLNGVFIDSSEVTLKAVVLHKGKGKGKVHPRTGHEGPEGE